MAGWRHKPLSSQSRAAPHPERIAGDTDDTVTAYIAMIARYESGGFTLDPPRIGQHTEEILAALGYSAEDIAKLIKAGSAETDRTPNRAAAE